MPDVLVLGAGVMGLSCAWRLAQGGASVTVLERDTVGSGATGASLGALWPPSPLAVGARQQFHRQSLAVYPAFIEELQAASNGRVSYRRAGRLEMVTDARQLENARREVGVGGEPSFELLTPAQARVFEPAVEPGDVGVVSDPGTAQVRTPELVDALVAACRNAGVTIREHSAVRQILIDHDTARGVQLETETLHAHKILATAGAWTAHLLPQLPVRPVRGQALQLRSGKPLLTRLVKRGPVYIVPWPQSDGTCLHLVGSTTEPEAGFDATTTEEAIQMLLTTTRAMVPALADATLERTWAGLRPDAPRHQPLTGPFPGVQNLYTATAHYKTGLALAPAVAEEIKTMLLENGLPFPINH